MAFLAVEGVSKHYGGNRALDQITFTVAERECVALLGPSGCGKSTLLNIVAGFIAPDRGDVRLAGTSLANTPPHRRDMAMVFQDYALFPHLTVAENVAFGLRMRRVGLSARRAAAARTLDLVGLAGFAERRIHELSGGQRQRVAVARALAVEPRLLLLDEPLSNLDARLREAMRAEIKTLLLRTGSTALFVTHDQAEAFAVADRVLLLNHGRIEQAGPPDELYERPTSRFAATFLGHCNLIPGTIAAIGRAPDGQAAAARPLVRSALGDYRATWPAALGRPEPGRAVTLAIRPHHLHVAATAVGNFDNEAEGLVETITYLGGSTTANIRHRSGFVFVLETPGRASFAPGQPVTVRWSAADTWIICDESLPNQPAMAPETGGAVAPEQVAAARATTGDVRC